MGNCTFKGVSREFPISIRVLTDSGSVLEFKGPKLVGDKSFILIQVVSFFSKLLLHHQYPMMSHCFVANPITCFPLEERMLCNKGLNEEETNIEYLSENLDTEWVNVDETRDNIKKSSPQASEYVESLGDGSTFEVLPSGGDGVWRVKLMIDTKKLEEILSEQGNIEALIERMRLVATLTPRHHSKSFRAEGLRLSFSNLFKVAIDKQK